MEMTFWHFLHVMRWTRSAKRCCQSFSGMNKRALHVGQSMGTDTSRPDYRWFS
jgi:hypothetical protein